MIVGDNVKFTVNNGNINIYIDKLKVDNSTLFVLNNLIKRFRFSYKTNIFIKHLILQGVVCNKLNLSSLNIEDLLLEYCDITKLIIHDIVGIRLDKSNISVLKQKFIVNFIYTNSNCDNLIYNNFLYVFPLSSLGTLRNKQNYGVFTYSTNEGVKVETYKSDFEFGEFSNIINNISFKVDKNIMLYKNV